MTVLIGATSGAQPQRWYAKSAALRTVPLSGPGGFSLEYPAKDWFVVPGGGSALVVLGQRKGEAGIVIERMLMNQALGRNEITTLFARIEIDLIRERDPNAGAFESSIIEGENGRLVVIQFSRLGIRGSELVRQYSLPVGRVLYRMTCAGLATTFLKYDAVCSHVAASFRATAAPE